MDYNDERNYDLDFYTTAGALAPRADGTAGGQAGTQSSMGRTLTLSTTYYVPLGSTDAPVPSTTELNCVHIKWDASVILTITIETSCFPATLQRVRHGPTDVAEWDTTKGNWIQENPSANVYISTTSTDASTGGATVTNMTIAVAGGAAGGSTIHFGNLGSRRCRIKFVVGTTGGVVRCAVNGKAGA